MNKIKQPLFITSLKTIYILRIFLFPLRTIFCKLHKEQDVIIKRHLGICFFHLRRTIHVESNLIALIIINSFTNLNRLYCYYMLNISVSIEVNRVLIRWETIKERKEEQLCFKIDNKCLILDIAQLQENIKIFLIRRDMLIRK